MSDSEARDVAVTEFKKTLLVEAGAGTGKTTLLVRRICALIESGVKVERIAAVTFTVKAAGELKERLRLELKKSDTPQASEALQFLDRMAVGTIHSLAAEFLRTLPIEAQLPPEFIPLDELQQASASRDFRTEWLSQMLNRATPRAFELAERLGIDLLGTGDKSLAGLFNSLVASAIDLQCLSTTTVGETLSSACAILQSQIRALAGRAELCTDKSDKLYAGIIAVVQWSASQPADVLSEAGIEWLTKFKKPSYGSAKNWGGKEELTGTKELVAEIVEQKGLVAGLLTSMVCNEIVEWIKPAVSEFRSTLRARGAISFDDQLLLCRNMLRDSKIARDFFKSRFDHIHIDEFQDTDPVQVEILYFLSEQKRAHAKSWMEVSLEPGKLFVVGDPKQSIYGFRGADLRIYKNVAQRIEADKDNCAKLSIVQNFRSFPAILEEVNKVFAPVMLGQSEFEAAYEPLKPKDGAEDDSCAVELLIPPSSYSREGASAKQLAAHEAGAIAGHIQTLKATERDFDLSKVAVLMLSGTNAASLVNSFGVHGIPFVSFLNSAYASRVEVEAVLTMLHALANPQHTTAVIGVLRSPWFAVSDDEIFEHKLSGRTFVYTDPQPDDSRAGQALNSLHRWHKRSRETSASSLLDFLFDEFPIEIVFGLKSEGVQRAQNLQALPGIIRKLETAGSSSLADIAARLSEMTSFVQSTELEARDENRKSVQVMTLHKAKGLEFDYVYLYSFSDHTKSDSGWLVHKGLENGDHQIALKVSDDFATQNYDFVKTAKANARDAELQRLLYVGMTRAKRKLILPLGWKRRKKKGNVPYVPSALAPRYRLDEANHIDLSATKATATAAVFSPESNFFPYATQLQIEQRDDGSSAAQFHQWKEVRAARLKELSVESAEKKQEQAIAWERVRARRVGSFVHAVLEQLAKGKSQEHAERLALRTLSLDSDDLTEARTMIGRARKSNLFSVELPAAQKIFTELACLYLISQRFMRCRDHPDINRDRLRCSHR